MLRQRVRAFRPRPRVRCSPLLQAAALLLAAGARILRREAVPSGGRPARPRRLRRPSVRRPPPCPISKPSRGSPTCPTQPADKDGRVGIGFDVTTPPHDRGAARRARGREAARVHGFARTGDTAGEKSRAIELVVRALRRAAGSAPVVARDRGRAVEHAAQGPEPGRPQEGGGRARDLPDVARDPDRLPRGAALRQESRRAPGRGGRARRGRQAGAGRRARSSRCARRRSIPRKTTSSAPRRRPH